MNAKVFVLIFKNYNIKVKLRQNYSNCYFKKSNFFASNTYSLRIFLRSISLQFDIWIYLRKVSVLGFSLKKVSNIPLNSTI